MSHLPISTATLVAALCLATACVQPSKAQSPNVNVSQLEVENAVDKEAVPTVQIALLLDTSNSMDGLINQAKSELWSIVQEASRHQNNNLPIRLEVALYEYGNDGLNAETGYVRQVLPMTDDLDRFSEALFSLNTNGGSEYCGTVMKHALEHLKWRTTDSSSCRLLYIAGNEEFTQGPDDYSKISKALKEQGIAVNTIHCGSRHDGISGRWQDGAATGAGDYLVIDSDQQINEPDTPFDNVLVELNTQLNRTYIAYGAQGQQRQVLQHSMDHDNMKLNKKAGIGRIQSKAQQSLNINAYNNNSWDLVDAQRESAQTLSKMQVDELPENMRKMSLKERESYIQQVTLQRELIQKAILQIGELRGQYLKTLAEQQSQPTTYGEAILESLRGHLNRQGFSLIEIKPQPVVDTPTS